MNSTYTWKNQFFYASVFLFAVSLPFSEFMISLSSVLLFISWLLTGRFPEKWKQLKHQPAALLIISIFFVYVIGIFFTQDMTLALYDLKKTAFILVIPLCISTGPTIGYTLFRKIIVSFLAALNLATVIALVRLIFRDQFGIHDIWQILFVSHIGFTFQLLLAISILIYELYNNSSIQKSLRNILIADILYLIAFLFILKSLTGLATFALLLIIHLIFIIRKIRIRKWKLLAVVMLPLMILGGFAYVGWCIHHFYDIEQVDLSRLPQKTQNGHLYQHDIANKVLENGHYMGLYVCEEELQKSWPSGGGTAGRRRAPRLTR